MPHSNQEFIEIDPHSLCSSFDQPITLSPAIQRLVAHLGQAEQHHSWTRSSLYTFLYRELSQLGALHTLDAYSVHLPNSWRDMLGCEQAGPMKATEFLALFAAHITPVPLTL